MNMKNNSNLWRAIIGILLGCLLIFLANMLANNIVESKAKPKTKIENKVNKIFTQTVQNGEVPVTIFEKGNLQALRKVELYAEVQGILKTGNKLFKPGQSYSKGNTLFSIDDAEFKAGLVAQKSVLYNLIAQVMPDLKLDYPDVFEKWNQYLSGFQIEQSTPTLPIFSTDREKYFINSKNIITTYYNIKNLEEKHKKYNIYSPFYAIVTESLVNPGALIRTGQPLGTIISPSVYEVPISVNESYKDYLAIGKKVTLHNLSRTASWTGKIARINATINPSTQGIVTYVEVSGKGLKDGMFVEAEITGKAITDGFEIARKLLIDNATVYTVEDQKLKSLPVDVAFFKSKTAIITGLPDGTILLNNAVPGAYDGMLVEIVNETNSSN